VQILNNWPWLSPILPVILGWLGRRRIGSLWNSKKNLAICENEREYLYRALKELTGAARQVKAAEAEGSLTTSERSANVRSNSRGNLSRLPTRRKSDRDDLRSIYPDRPRGNDDET